MDKVYNKGTGRLFQNPLLEAITRTSPTITIVAYVPVFILSAWYALFHLNISILAFTGVFFSAVFFWTLIEYLLHRYVFHYVNDHEIVKKIHFTIHGVHHQYPRDKDRLFMPPAFGYTIMAAWMALFWFSMGDYAFAFLPGLGMGYLLYAFTHYSIHSYKPVKGLKFLWTNHSLHHYKYPDKAFGVSSPFWDYVFGTAPPSGSKYIPD